MLLYSVSRAIQSVRINLVRDVSLSKYIIQESAV